MIPCKNWAFLRVDSIRVTAEPVASESVSPASGGKREAQGGARPVQAAAGSSLRDAEDERGLSGRQLLPCHEQQHLAVDGLESLQRGHQRLPPGLGVQSCHDVVPRIGRHFGRDLSG